MLRFGLLFGILLAAGPAVAACNPNELTDQGKCMQKCKDVYLTCVEQPSGSKETCSADRTACEAKCGCGK